MHEHSPVSGFIWICGSFGSHSGVISGFSSMHVLFLPGVVPSGQPHLVAEMAICSPVHSSHLLAVPLYTYFVFLHLQFGYVPVALDGHSLGANGVIW